MKMKEFSEKHLMTLIPERKQKKLPKGVRIVNVLAHFVNNFTIVVIETKKGNSFQTDFYTGVAKKDVQDKMNRSIGMRLAATRAYCELTGQKANYGMDCPNRNDAFRIKAADKTAEIFTKKVVPLVLSHARRPPYIPPMGSLNKEAMDRILNIRPTLRLPAAIKENQNAASQPKDK